MVLEHHEQDEPVDEQGCIGDGVRFPFHKEEILQDLNATKLAFPHLPVGELSLPIFRLQSLPQVFEGRPEGLVKGNENAEDVAILIVAVVAAVHRPEQYDDHMH